jgi:hypothetical protein
MNRYFVCVNGVIWTVYDDGRSNFPGDFRVVNNEIQVLGEADDDGCRLISDEYPLWNSLKLLAQEIELYK